MDFQAIEDLGRLITSNTRDNLIRAMNILFPAYKRLTDKRIVEITTAYINIVNNYIKNHQAPNAPPAPPVYVLPQIQIAIDNNNKLEKYYVDYLSNNHIFRGLDDKTTREEKEYKFNNPLLNNHGFPDPHIATLDVFKLDNDNIIKFKYLVNQFQKAYNNFILLHKSIGYSNSDEELYKILNNAYRLPQSKIHKGAKGYVYYVYNVLYQTPRLNSDYELYINDPNLYKYNKELAAFADKYRIDYYNDDVSVIAEFMLFEMNYTQPNKYGVYKFNEEIQIMTKHKYNKISKAHWKLDFEPLDEFLNEATPKLPSPGMLNNSTQYYSEIGQSEIDYILSGFAATLPEEVKEPPLFRGVNFIYYEFKTKLYRYEAEIENIYKRLTLRPYILFVHQYPIVTIHNVNQLTRYKTLSDLVAKGADLKYDQLIDYSLSADSCGPDLLAFCLIMTKNNKIRKLHGGKNRELTIEWATEQVDNCIYFKWPLRPIIGGFKISELCELAKELGFEYFKAYDARALYDNNRLPFIDEKFRSEKNAYSPIGLSVVCSNNHIYRFKDRVMINDHSTAIHPALQRFDNSKYIYYDNLEEYITMDESGTDHSEYEIIYVGQEINNFHKSALQRNRVYPVLNTNPQSMHVTSFIFNNKKIKYIHNYELGLAVGAEFLELDKTLYPDSYTVYIDGLLASNPCCKPKFRPGIHSPNVITLSYIARLSPPDKLSPSVYESIKKSTYQAPKGCLKREYSKNTSNYKQYDLNKAYLSIFRSFEFPTLTIYDDLIKYNGDDEIKEFNYYEISKLLSFRNTLFMNGQNELYPGKMIKRALELNYIKLSDISRILEPKSKRVNLNIITDRLIDKFGLSQANKIIRETIGTMRISDTESIFKLIYSRDYNELLYFANNNHDLIGRAIYDEIIDNNINKQCKFLNIQDLKDYEGIMYYKYISTSMTYENFNFIQSMILKLSQFEIAEYALKLTTINKVMAINCDTIIINENEISNIISDEIGGLKIVEDKIFSCDYVIQDPVPAKIEIREVNNLTMNKYIDNRREIITKINNEGCVIDAMGGCGKSYLAIECVMDAIKNNKNYIICANKHIIKSKLYNDLLKLGVTDQKIKPLTIHSLLGLVDNAHVESKVHLLTNCQILYLDEYATTNPDHLRLLKEYQNKYEFKVVLMGDWCQGPGVDCPDIPKNSSLIRELVNYNQLILTHNWRLANAKSTDKNKSYITLLQEIWNAIYAGDKCLKFRDTLRWSDFKSKILIFGKKECRRSLCLSNKKVDEINNKWIQNEKNNYIIVDNRPWYVGMPIISEQNRLEYKNGEIYHIIGIEGSTVILRDGWDESETTEIKLIIDINKLKHFKANYAMTITKGQGLTIKQEYSIYEWDMPYIMSYDIYRALSRGIDVENVNLI